MNTRLEKHKIETRKSQFAALSKPEQDARIIQHYLSLVSAARDGYYLCKQLHPGTSAADRQTIEAGISIIANSIRAKQTEDFGFSFDGSINEWNEENLLAHQELRLQLHEMARLFPKDTDYFIYER